MLLAGTTAGALTLSPEVIAAVLALLAALASGAFWHLYGRINTTNDDVDEVGDDVQGLTTKVETLWAFAFGREDDATDGGIAEDIEEGFDSMTEDVNRLEKKVDTYHEDESEQIRNLVDALHDEEDLDFERDDVYDDDD